MSSNKFTRLHGVHRTETDPNAVAATSRIYGDQVAVGQPMHIQGMIDPEQEAAFRRDVQESLEFLAKKRLLEAEKEAQAFLEKSRQLAREEGEKLVNDLLEKARAEAAGMIAQAQSEVDGIRDAAHEEGFKNGFEEGYTAGLQQVDEETVELLKSAHFVVESAYQAERRILKEFESHATTIIQRIAEKVLCDDLEDASEKILNLIQRSVESLYLSGKVKVVLNPQVLHELRQFSANTQQAVDALSRFEFIADPALDTYQYFILSQEASFDISPKSQTAQLLEPIEKNLKLPRPSETQDEANASISQNTNLASEDETLSATLFSDLETDNSALISEALISEEEHVISIANSSENSVAFPTSEIPESASEKAIQSQGYEAFTSNHEEFILPPEEANLMDSFAQMNTDDSESLLSENAISESSIIENNDFETLTSEQETLAPEGSLSGIDTSADVASVLAKLDDLTIETEAELQESHPDIEDELGTPPWLKDDASESDSSGLSAFEAPVVMDSPRVFGRAKAADRDAEFESDESKFLEIDLADEEQA